MNDIEQIYYNNLGVAFHWIQNDVVLKERVQIVFKEIGFYLTLNEIKDFAQIINTTCKNCECGDCPYNNNQCHRCLLKTPLQHLDLAVSQTELLEIKDLVEGTLFTIELLDYISNVCRN
jgi:hypothetical protein